MAGIAEARLERGPGARDRSVARASSRCAARPWWSAASCSGLPPARDVRRDGRATTAAALGDGPRRRATTSTTTTPRTTSRSSSDFLQGARAMSTDGEVRAQVVVVGAGPVGAIDRQPPGPLRRRHRAGRPNDRGHRLPPRGRHRRRGPPHLPGRRARRRRSLADTIQNVPLKFFDARGRCFADVRPDARGSSAGTAATSSCSRSPRRPCAPGWTASRTCARCSVTSSSVCTRTTTRRALRRSRAADGETESSSRPDYVVAADGGRSTIRELLGVPARRGHPSAQVGGHRLRERPARRAVHRTALRPAPALRLRAHAATTTGAGSSCCSPARTPRRCWPPRRSASC